MKRIYIGLFIYNSHGFEHADSVDGQEHAKKKRISKKQEEWIEVSDESWRIVSDEPVPDKMKQDPKLWSGCIAGAFTEDDA